MFLGRRQLGQWIDVCVQATEADKTPALPVEPPVVTIRRASDGVSVYNREMPIVEKQGTGIGLFAARVFLGDGFSAGQYNVQIAFTVGSFTDLQLRTFTIVGGGHPNGQVFGMAYFKRPNRANIIYQTESGSLLRGSNPKIT